MYGFWRKGPWDPQIILMSPFVLTRNAGLLLHGSLLPNPFWRVSSFRNYETCMGSLLKRQISQTPISTDGVYVIWSRVRPGIYTLAHTPAHSDTEVYTLWQTWPGRDNTYTWVPSANSGWEFQPPYLGLFDIDTVIVVLSLCISVWLCWRVVHMKQNTHTYTHIYVCVNIIIICVGMCLTTTQMNI